MGRATVIKPSIYRNFNGKAKDEVKNVAAYCRVSSDKDEQLNSYENQVSYYTALINENPDWEMSDVYADEGISGTNTDKRDEFHRMIKDAEEGKIDLIITKSISRFARNTVDTLNYTRKLKALGVAVKFEKENINTMEASGELMMTIFSSLAQEESRSISENSKWGIVKGFKDGKVFCNTTRFLGYDKDENGNLIINEEEAEIIKRIYKEYLEGKSYQKIADGLEKDDITTSTGNKKWWDSTIVGILKNEKYYGALLQQKTVTVDFLSHKRVKNRGYADQYLIEDNHSPIVSKEVFEAVQEEMECRATLKGNIKGDRGKYSSKYAMSGKIECGDCGASFKRRTWNSKSTSKKIVWQCKTYIKEGKNSCSMKAVGEDVLMDAFVRMFNGLKEDKGDFIKTLQANIEKVLAKSGNKIDIGEVEEQIKEIKEEIHQLVQMKLKKQIGEEIYNEQYEKMEEQLQRLQQEKSEYDADVVKRNEYKKRVEEIVSTIREQEGLLEQFDEDIFNALVEKIEVLSPTHFVFVLKSGMRVEEKMK
jgi:site-specific DNA recombinase